jgi:hypothetical protein
MEKLTVNFLWQQTARFYLYSGFARLPKLIAFHTALPAGMRRHLVKATSARRNSGPHPKSSLKPH